MPISRLENVLDCLQEMEDGEHLALNKVLPDQPRQRYEFIQSLETNGLSVSIMLLTHSSGNNVGNLHFVWKLPADKPVEVEEAFSRECLSDKDDKAFAATISHTYNASCHIRQVW